jgi:DNA-binding MarR family transcriptional regulator
MKKKTIEEYIELIHILEKKDGHAHTGTIAAEMEIKAPSVTQMLQKLEKEGLVRYQSYMPDRASCQHRIGPAARKVRRISAAGTRISGKVQGRPGPGVI